MKCPKCNDEMEEGLQLDASYGGVRKAMWVKGKELPTIKISILPPKVEITGERYYTTVYRCSSCGFLESYAQEQA
jgi:predicted nucleic-acid-binding Zn-ribbon protein